MRHFSTGKVSDGFVIALGVGFLFLIFGMFVITGNMPLWYPLLFVLLVGIGVFLARWLHKTIGVSPFASYLVKGRCGIWVASIVLAFALFGRIYLVPIPWAATVLFPLQLACNVVPSSICWTSTLFLSPIFWGMLVNAIIFLSRKQREA